VFAIVNTAAPFPFPGAATAAGTATPIAITATAAKTSLFIAESVLSDCD
jgi:hypothetical protein